MVEEPIQTRSPDIVIFVRHFERCLKFYQNALGFKLVYIYRGKEHPRWAELQSDELRIALHAGYKGPIHKSGEPLAIQFHVKDIDRTLKMITRYGGSVKRPKRRIDFRPAELRVVYEATFTDPDGNEVEAQQVIKECS